MEGKIARTTPGSGTSAEGGEELVKPGSWYWVESEEGPWLGCAVHVGSNYAKIEAPSGGSVRVHFDDFLRTCRPEESPDSVIDGKVAHYRSEVNRLLGRVKEVTARLAVGPSAALNASNETMALAVRVQGQDMKEYGQALEIAKKETLPDLFKKIESANEKLAYWMTAKVVPLKAQAEGLKSVISSIEERIFSVQLYAGLVEQIVTVKDGEPAGLSEKVRLFQRRHYMDEECLAEYRAGGMTLQGIGGFDDWIAQSENMERLLPFPRCVVAFKVRRHAKEREAIDVSDFFRIIDEECADKLTFLYIRNGQKIFRMRTRIDFGEHLFPDFDREKLSGKLWAEEFAGSIRKIISDNEYRGMKEERDRSKREWEAKNKTYKAALKTPEAKAKAKAKGLKHPDASCVDAEYPGFSWHDWHDVDRYIPYDKTNVYFDEITKKTESMIRDHNRIALVIQGLLDRSPVLHPHPPWQIWTQAGLEAALELIFDETRALAPGPKPDFEAYRKKLNENLKAGSVTVGQDDAWSLAEGEKESRRMNNDYRTKGHYRPTRWRPHGNPGPGVIARVESFSRKSGMCSFAWNRKRQTYPNYGDPVRTTFTCHSEALLNVDAYRPGDFKIFFKDPRTRLEYLKWAPFLLEAEEYHAGNRKLDDPPPPSPAKPSSWEGRIRYERRKLRKALTGKCVKLVRRIETTGGTKYEPGSLWKVIGGEGATFNIRGVRADGTRDDPYRSVRKVHSSDFEIVELPPADEDC